MLLHAAVATLPCLPQEAQDDIVVPCGRCSGSVRHAHLACLKAWVAERGSLDCEICGKPWAHELLPQLGPLVKAAEEKKRRHAFLRLPALIPSGDGREDEEELTADSQMPQVSWIRFWCA